MKYRYNVILNLIQDHPQSHRKFFPVFQEIAGQARNDVTEIFHWTEKDYGYIIMAIVFPYASIYYLLVWLVLKLFIRKIKPLNIKSCKNTINYEAKDYYFDGNCMVYAIPVCTK